jgi:superfamily II DNA or RNA helicase
VKTPVLTLLTLTRGDGLLGLRAAPGFGPRGAQLTVARVEAGEASEAGEAMLIASGLKPLPAAAVQWRHHRLAQAHPDLWSLAEEAHWGDWWEEQVPRLQAGGWRMAVGAGFAHFSAPVQRWKLSLDADAPRELESAPPARTQGLAALRGPAGPGSWRMSLGVEVEGEWLDLAPLVADLLKRDARWLRRDEVAAFADDAIVVLRAPGGRRIKARAAPLKAVVSAMLDVLTAPGRKPGPLRLSDWDAQRAEALRLSLAGSGNEWQLEGDAALSRLALRLRQAGSPPPVPAPPGLGLTLRPYQLQGLAWLQHLREHDLAGILADDMGLGKTAQVLAHLLVELQAGRLDRPALLVLPTSLVANWQSEAARHAPALRVLTLQGPRRKADFARLAGHHLVITSYALVWRDLDALRRQPWHLLVLDEAQLAKTAGSRAASAARRLQARHRLCVTGTPLENHLGELWAHFHLLMPGFLGDARSFARLWRRPIETNGETLRAQLLAHRVRPFILRRRKDEVLTELPPKTEVLRRVALQGQQRALYESVRLAADEQVRKVLLKDKTAGAPLAVLAALLKLRQVCCDPRLLLGSATPPTMESAKLEWLCDMLPGLVQQGRRVLVFSQFTALLALVRQALEPLSLPCLLLTGRTPPAARDAVVQQFQAQTPACPLMLVSLKAGGVGLNLTAADTVIHLDPWWNPAVEQQASDRAHRIGQDQPVFVYRLVAEGSIEERMLALQARKSALAEGVLGRDAGHATKFSVQELSDLLAPLS